MTIASSLILNYAAKQNFHMFSIMALGLIALAILVNVLKFVFWGYLHKRFDLSKTYPLTAIFFPLIFLSPLNLHFFFWCF